jgi:DNA-binding response OmpR family regulator
VEDDDAIAEGLVRVFEGQELVVERVSAGRPALERVMHDTALVLLDLGLPDIDGIEVCRRLRRAHPSLAIVILTARGQELDVVAGLDAGADDYIVKPFRLSELLARVRAHLRRAGDSRALEVGDVRIDPAARRAWRGDTELELTPKEFDLLAALARDPGAAVSRRRLLEDVWQTTWYGSTKTIDVHVAALRRKLGDPGLIETVRGVGFRLRA